MRKNLLIVLKSILYRIYSSLITFLITYAITKEVSLGVFVSVSDFIIKIFTYYIYEFAWDKIINKKNKTNKL